MVFRSHFVDDLVLTNLSSCQVFVNFVQDQGDGVSTTENVQDIHNGHVNLGLIMNDDDIESGNGVHRDPIVDGTGRLPPPHNVINGNNDRHANASLQRENLFQVTQFWTLNHLYIKWNAWIQVM